MRINVRPGVELDITTRQLVESVLGLVLWVASLLLLVQALTAYRANEGRTGIVYGGVATVLAILGSLLLWRFRRLIERATADAEDRC